MRQTAFFIVALAAAGCATVPTDAALEAEDLCEFSREKGPEGLSVITRIGGNRYYCVNDRRGLLAEREMPREPHLVQPHLGLSQPRCTQVSK